MVILTVDLAIRGKTMYPTPPAARASRALIMKEFSSKKGGISCEQIAATVSKMNATIRRKISFSRIKMKSSAKAGQSKT